MRRICQCCKDLINEDDGITITTDNLDDTFMHQSCFDDIWSSFLNRKSVTKILEKCSKVVLKEAIKKQSQPLFAIDNAIKSILNEGI